PYAPAVEATLAAMMPRNSPIEPLRLFRTLAQNLPLGTAMTALGSFVLGRGLSLDLRTRELLIDRTCARCGCEYEWGVHALVYGARAGFGPDELSATVNGGPDALVLVGERRAARSSGRRAARHGARVRRPLGCARGVLDPGGAPRAAPHRRVVPRDRLHPERRPGRARRVGAPLSLGAGPVPLARRSLRPLGAPAKARGPVRPRAAGRAAGRGVRADGLDVRLEEGDQVGVPDRHVPEHVETAGAIGACV